MTRGMSQIYTTRRQSATSTPPSDNGPEPGLGSAGELRGAQGQLYEGGIRSPLIVWSSGIMPRETVGSSNDVTVICGIDLCPSLLALARAKVPA